MQMSIETQELTRALHRVQGIVDRKSTMPILAHVLLNASVETQQLEVSATDQDIGLTGSYAAKVQKSGKVAVPAKHLYDISKSLRESSVTLTTQDNHWVEIVAGNSRFHLVGIAADEFPALNIPPQRQTFGIAASLLKQMIDRTLFCVSTDENRHNLTGIFCQSPQDKCFRMVSTDGHRLALAESLLEESLGLSEGVIVPHKCFHELRRILDDSGDINRVEMSFTNNSLVVKAGSVTLLTRLIEGMFPNYDQVIPKAGSKRANMARGKLLEALRRVALLAHSKAQAVRFAFDTNSLQLVAENPEYGDAQETLAIGYEGEPLTIGFNARYILDILGLLTETEVVFELSDNLSPGIVKPLATQGFLAVVMPLRI